ncbi:hypothetical protein HMPREF9997_01974 [Corynebacterium durum F0235]|uniref:Uncharacterized protein n=1 Tax=Corynebacterium durum F0235 TaxID=1035195 RepID=L1ME39_9CORY|nr:hypothetical protein HMPREF9997_01974 [Corynebacterium durum F0235]
MASPISATKVPTRGRNRRMSSMYSSNNLEGRRLVNSYVKNFHHPSTGLV